MTQGCVIPKPLEGEAWHVIKDVPLFVEHEIVVRHGKQTKKETFDARRLKRICDNVEKDCSEGRFPIIQEDHLPEDAQPDSSKINQFGFTCNHHIKTVKDPQGRERTWIFGDELIYPSKVKEREAYPYRSIEMHLGQDVFCPVSLLKHTPRLNVGVTLPIDVRRGKVPAGRLGTLAYSLPRRLSVRVGQAGHLVYSLHGGRSMADEVTFDSKALATALEGLNSALKPLLDGKVQFSKRSDPADVEVIGDNDTPAAGEIAELKKRLEALESTNGTSLTYSRRRKLEELAKEYNLDVETEMKEYGSVSDEEFTRLESTIKRCYSRRGKGGGAMVEPITVGGDPTYGGMVNADHVAMATQIAPLVRDKTGQNIDVGRIAHGIAQGKYKEFMS